MPRNRSESAVPASIFYFFGIVMSVGCLSLIFSGNTGIIWRYEHIGVPLSWVTGACAILAFVAFEYCESRASAKPSAFLEFSMDPAARQPELS
jgi:hypothetical protein